MKRDFEGKVLNCNLKPPFYRGLFHCEHFGDQAIQWNTVA